MTEIREPNFAVDMPGEWEQAESPEEGTIAYEAKEGRRRLNVTLLGVKRMYSIADPEVLLKQYMDHRQTYEKGPGGSLEQTPPVCEQAGETIEGSWEGVHPVNGKRVRHRLILADQLLADFAYEAYDLDEDAYRAQADAILGSASVTP